MYCFNQKRFLLRRTPLFSFMRSATRIERLKSPPAFYPARPSPPPAFRKLRPARQRHADRQNIADSEMRYARCHRRKNVGVFIDVCEQADARHARQRRVAMRDRDDLRAAVQRRSSRVQNVVRAAGIRNHHDHIARAQQRRRRRVRMRIRIRDARHAQPEEFVLNIQRGNARTARAVKLDTPRIAQETQWRPPRYPTTSCCAPGSTRQWSGRALSPRRRRRVRRRARRDRRRAHLDAMLCASRILNSRKPENPSAWQNRAMVGWLTPARAAKSVIGEIEHFARRFQHVIGELALGRAQLLAHCFDLGQQHRESRLC